MPENVVLIPSKEKKAIREQELRVAAYCRVSTKHEEQLISLENQITYYTHFIKQIQNWQLVAVYYDSVSGVRDNKRHGYKNMLEDCAKGKIDLILVKSLSRFGRDALEAMRQIRKSKGMNIRIYFETGGINTMETDQSVIDLFAAFTQEKSHDLSENIKFGIRQRMKSGKTILNHSQFLGYTKGPDGILQIVPEEAEIVRKIFELYLQGNGVRKIKRYLEDHEIKTVTGKSEWSTSTIDRMLSNEKYIGQVLMQKTYTPDFLTGKQEKNRGQLAMYLIENAHEPIIERAVFERVQGMKGRIKKS